MSPAIKLLKKSTVVLVISIFGVVLIGNIPIIIAMFRTLKGYYYPYLDKIFFTNFHYIAVMRAAMHTNSWLSKHPYIYYDHDSNIMQTFYVILGKISFISGIGPFEIFAIFRIIGGIFLIAAVYWFFRSILHKSNVFLATVLFLLYQPMPMLDAIRPRFFQDFGLWVWDVGEATRRATMAAPHYTFGKAGTIIALFCMLEYFKGKSFFFVIIGFLIALISGIIYPIPNFTLLFAVSAGLSIQIFFSIFNRAQKVKCKEILGYGIFSIFLLIPVFVLYHASNQGFPANIWNTAELGYNTPKALFEQRYLAMLGMLVIFIPFSVKRFFHKNAPILNHIILMWFLSSFIAFPFANQIGLGKNRLIDGNQNVAYIILVVWGIDQLRKLMTNKIKPEVVSKVSILFLILIVMNFILFAGLNNFFTSMRIWPIATNIFFQPGEINALNYLENIAKDQVVLTDWDSATYLPAFAAVRTTTGNPIVFSNAKDYEKEVLLTSQFLRNELPDETALHILKSRNIRYVYARADIYLYPKYLRRMYQNGKYVIFEVRKLL